MAGGAQMTSIKSREQRSLMYFIDKNVYVVTSLCSRVP